MSTRTFALIFGIVFLAVGALGFIAGPTAMGGMGHPMDDKITMTSFFGYELKLFPVNALHSAVHILFGLAGLLAARSLGGARTYFRAVALIYAVLAVMGLVPALQTTFGYIPLYGNDVWLHAVLAIVAAYFGWINRDTAADRT